MPVFFRPGQQWKEFKLYRSKTTLNQKGSIQYEPIKQSDKPLGIVHGFLAAATQKEVNQWEQMKHPISHTIVVNGDCVAQAEDILVYENKQYIVKGKDNPFGLGIFQIIYCESK